MKITKIKLSQLKPYEGNAKLHPEEQIKQIMRSIEEFGNNDPIAVDEDYVIIEGHGRYEALKRLGYEEAECIVLKGMTEDQKNAYRLVHNKLTMNSDFDLTALYAELEKIDIDMTEFDFDYPEPDAPESHQNRDYDDFSDVGEEEPKTHVGDLWRLGSHYLLCGDATREDDVKKLMGGTLADCVFTDPPYGMKKESDGVANDNLNYDDLLDFNKKWIPISFDFLKDTGGWYCFGIDEPLMDIYSEILKPMKKRNEIVIRNYITWAKHAAFGLKSSLMLSYPKETEKCWFVVKGRDWDNNNMEFFNNKYQKLLDYLTGEAEKVGLTPKMLHQITGVQMYGHWFSKSQFTVIPTWHYEKLQANFNKDGAFLKTHEELRELIGLVNDKKTPLKPYFDCTWFDDGDMPLSDVWRNPATSIAEREDTGDHATPKPIAICERAIKTSTREGETILDLFGGSGSTLIACEEFGRCCRMIELEPKWCDVIIKRWEDMTGKTAELITPDGSGD